MFQFAGTPVHVAPPSLEISKVVVTMPEAFEPPGSLAESVVRLTVEWRLAPGSWIWTTGGVLSTRRSVTGVPRVWLPATSVATVRKS